MKSEYDWEQPAITRHAAHRNHLMWEYGRERLTPREDAIES